MHHFGATHTVYSLASATSPGAARWGYHRAHLAHIGGVVPEQLPTSHLRSPIERISLDMRPHFDPRLDSRTHPKDTRSQKEHTYVPASVPRNAFDPSSKPTTSQKSLR
jgi:hypothetical protein